MHKFVTRWYEPMAWGSFVVTGFAVVFAIVVNAVYQVPISGIAVVNGMCFGWWGYERLVSRKLAQRHVELLTEYGKTVDQFRTLADNYVTVNRKQNQEARN